MFKKEGILLSISTLLLTESIEKNYFQLDQDESTIVGEGNLKVFITEYYKKLFGAPSPTFFLC
jgi:hypothetical protein